MIMMLTQYLREEHTLRFRLKPLIFVLSLLPMLLLIYGVQTENLGADPQKYIVHKTGAWTLRFLLITLSVTPLRVLLKWPKLLLMRRMFGLFVMFYAFLHLTAYYSLYLYFDWHNVLEDLTKRPYIIVGALAFVGLLPLALTSTRYAMRKLGRSWQKLHRLVYLIALLGVIHFLWQVKSDLNEPLLYLLILIVLLGYRLWHSFRRE